MSNLNKLPELLFHIAYYMNSSKRTDNKNGIDKTGSEFTEHVLAGVKHFLTGINSYGLFSKIDVVLDVNQANTDVKKIVISEYKNVNIRIVYHNFETEHPFRLATKHRLSMIDQINDYDWFGYSEDDTILSRDTIQYLVKNSVHLFEKEHKVYTIPRMVFNQKNEYFYSDIIKPSKRRSSVNGDIIVPTNRFGACWFYPRRVMREWVKCKSFLNFSYPNVNGGIRVKMGLGFMETDAVVPIGNDNEAKIRCVHLGYSGKYYFPHPAGFHKLPKNKLCV
jgi:hypothetical protein